jgi:Curli production assembly/transport component CsgG
MKTLLKFAMMAALALSVSKAAADQILTVAVLDFDSPDEAVHDLGLKVATLVSANLSAEPGLVTVERADLQKVLSEAELGMSGTVSPDSAATVGQLTGAKVLASSRPATR